MKKTITKPDGTQEVVEGTPEEIADYERALREGLNEVPKKDKKNLLLEDKSMSLLEQWRDLIEKAPKQPMMPSFAFNGLEHSPECQMTVAARGWMSIVPPRCDCGLITYPRRDYTTIATNRIDLIAPRTSTEITPDLTNAWIARNTNFISTTRCEARA